MNIKITMKQRIALESLLSIQQGKAAGELRVYFAILDKVTVPPNVRDMFLRPLPNGNAIWDDDALAIAELYDLEVETEEINKLIDLLTNWDRFITADLRWVNPLKKLLQEAQESSPGGNKKKAAGGLSKV